MSQDREGESTQVGTFANRWTPKEWTPLYETITFESCFGLSNVQLAEKYNYSAQQISNILNTPQAKQLKNYLTEKIRAQMLADVEKNQDVLVAAAQENIKAVLTDKELAAKSPFAMMKASMDYMKGVGKMIDSEKKQETHNTFIMSDKAAEKLMDGLNKAMDVKKLHAAEAVEVVSDGSENERKTA